MESVELTPLRSFTNMVIHTPEEDLMLHRSKHCGNSTENEKISPTNPNNTSKHPSSKN